MTTLGLSREPEVGSEIRVGFRSGWIRFVGVTVGGAGMVGLVVAVLELAEKQPAQFFDLLIHWGFAWLLGLAALAIAWDLAKSGISNLGKMADSVQSSSVAMNRMADRDDRERDRISTEVGYVGQRMERLGHELKADREAERQRNDRIETMLSELMKRDR